MENYTCKYCKSNSPIKIYNGIKDWEYGVEGSYSYQECQNCGGVQIHPFPTVDDLVKAYEIDYHGYVDSDKKNILYDILYKLNQKKMNKSLRRFVNPNSRVLDIGCGAGEFLLTLKNMGVQHLEGIDFSEKAIEMLVTKGIKGYQGIYEDFPADNSSYDLLIMNNYLEHTLDPTFELKKSSEILKAGGWLIGEVPGFDSYERKVFKRYWGGNHVPRHTFQFNQDFLKKKLVEAGFKNVQIVHELNTGHIALSIQNYLQRNVKDLRRNSKIKNGRSSLYYPLLLLSIPFNILPVLLRKAGVIKFYAQAV